MFSAKPSRHSQQPSYTHTDHGGDGSKLAKGLSRNRHMSAI